MSYEKFISSKKYDAVLIDYNISYLQTWDRESGRKSADRKCAYLGCSNRGNIGGKFLIQGHKYFSISSICKICAEEIVLPLQ